MRNWMILSLLALIPVYGVEAVRVHPRDLNIIFIGNSISAGAWLENPVVDSPPAKACEYLRQQQGVGTVICENQAVSGQTTADFLPAFDISYPRVVAAADRLVANHPGLLVFSVMLGTNDSAIKGPNGAPVAPAQYRTNLSVIIDHLLARYPDCMVVLHRPIWYSENTHNGAMYLAEGLRRLEKYYPELLTLVGNYDESHPGHVFMGDTEAFDFFKQQPEHLFNHEKGNAGIFFLHPNREGAARLGEFWGKAIRKAIL